MTGELADIFPNRHQGVKQICRTMQKCLPENEIRFYSVAGFVKPEEVEAYENAFNRAQMVRDKEEARERRSWLQRGYLPILRVTQKRPVITIVAALLVLGYTFSLVPQLKTNLDIRKRRRQDPSPYRCENCKGKCKDRVAESNQLQKPLELEPHTTRHHSWNVSDVRVAAAPPIA
jgi:hypothetical protein